MILEIFLGVCSLLFLWYLYVKFVKWTFFEKLGVVQMPTSLPLGNYNEIIFQVNKLLRQIIRKDLFENLIERLSRY